MVEFVIKVIIPALCTILTLYLIPFLKEKRLYNYVVIAVKEAEQMFLESGKGKEKFAYVREWIQKKFKVTDDDLKNIIEAVVYEMNKEKKKNISDT
jgi:hypothetical protein